MLTGRQDCVGIAFKDNDGCWKVSQISKEGDLLLQDGGWDKVGEYSCQRISPKCVKSKKKKSEDDGIQLAAVVTKEEAIDEIRKEEEGVGR